MVMEGIPSNYIDTVLVYKDGVYHAFTKGVPNTEHAVADNVEGPYTLVQTGMDLLPTYSESTLVLIRVVL